MGRGSVLFVDEVHRFNKSQQDVFLPYVEDGTFTFIGATTENPSFERNNALLSDARVYVLKSLTVEDIDAVLLRVLSDCERGLGSVISYWMKRCVYASPRWPTAMHAAR